MLTKLYSGDYQFLKSLDSKWEYTADYETLYRIAHILYEFHFWRYVSEVFEFIDKPNRVTTGYNGVKFTVRNEIESIIEEYEESVKEVK